jgi:hypothetical protein
MKAIPRSSVGAVSPSEGLLAFRADGNRPNAEFDCGVMPGRSPLRGPLHPVVILRHAAARFPIEE